MTFRPRNVYYLRISTNIILPLFLYLDERHIDWMSDTVLQHVLVDLRPLIIPKLQAEKDVHFGPGTAPVNRRGSVEVHRGETYQFAYFFRKTEPQTLLFKSRHFAIASPQRSEVIPQPASMRLADRDLQKTNLSASQSKRKRGVKKSPSHFDEWSAEESAGDMDDTDADLFARGPRPVRKQRRVITDAYQEDDAEDTCQDVAMNSPRPGADSEDPTVLIVEDRDAVAQDANDSSSAVDIKLVIEEEEKPKPLLKLKYQSFPMSGNCLCVVVEPWPPLRPETKLSMGLGPSRQRGGLEPPRLPSSGSVMAGERAKTPLFLPEYDMTLNDAPFAGEKILPPVPLFRDTLLTTDEYNDEDLMIFSQTLNTAGHVHAIAADDDDMDGAVLFGDADEVRELF